MSHKSPVSRWKLTHNMYECATTTAAVYKINPLNAGLKGITLYLIDKVEPVNYVLQQILEILFYQRRDLGSDA